MSRRTRILQLKAESASLELEDVEEQLSDYRKKFHEDFPEELGFLRWKKEQEIVKEEEDKIKLDAPEDISKIYRAVARITHPDICEDEEKQELFKSAASAYKNGNWYELLSIANSCGVDNYEMSVETMILIEEQIENMTKKTQGLKQQVAWVWCNREPDADEEKMKQLMRRSLSIDESEFEKWKEEKKNGTLGRT